MSWRAIATNLTTRIYGPNSKHESQINRIVFQNYHAIANGSIYTSGNNAQECKTLITDLVESIEIDISEFGMPERFVNNSKNKGDINISLSQNQTVDVQLIWNSINDEMTESQQRQIEEILQSKES